MALTINTNISSMIAQRSLNNATNALNLSIERMTTGYKINHASDNAAGYSISNMWVTQLGSLDVAADNAATGADLLTTAGTTRVLAMDLHTGQIQGYFNILVDHLQSMPIFVDYIKSKNIPHDDLVLVSPDAGGVERTRHFARYLDAPIAIIDKRREQHNVAKVGYVIGDVKDKTCVMFDDMIDTAGTITEGAKLLKKYGAKDVYICASHPVFSGPAIERLANSEAKEVIVTNTIPLDKDKLPDKIVQLNVATLLGKAITRIHDDESVSSLFE